MKARQYHTTDDEILYVMSIGKHCHNARRVPRISILKKYIKSAYERIDWCGMNSEEIIRYAERELQDELNKANA
jgi:hypothetical protein